MPSGRERTSEHVRLKSSGKKRPIGRSSSRPSFNLLSMIGIVLLVLLFLVMYVSTATRLARIERENLRLQQEVERLENENDSFLNRIRELTQPQD